MLTVDVICVPVVDADCWYCLCVRPSTGRKKTAEKEELNVPSTKTMQVGKRLSVCVCMCMCVCVCVGGVWVCVCGGCVWVRACVHVCKAHDSNINRFGTVCILYCSI